MSSTQNKTTDIHPIVPSSAQQEYEAEPAIVQNLKQKKTEISVTSPDAGLGFTLSKKQRTGVIEQ